MARIFFLGMLSLLLLFNGIVEAQTNGIPTIPDKVSRFIKPDSANKLKPNGKEWNRVLNSAFGRLLGSQGNPTTIGNYASFEPVNGSFTFKGTVALGKRDSINMSYLALSANGDLISSSYAALFTNTKLNTNTGIQLEYSFRLGKNDFETNTANETRYYVDKWAALDSSVKAKNAFIREINNINSKQELIKQQIDMGVLEISEQEKKIFAAKKLITDYGSDTSCTFEERKAVLELLTKKSADLATLQKNLVKLTYKSDSLNTNYQVKRDLVTWYKLKQDSILLKKQDKLLERFQFIGVKFTYLTLTAGAGKKTYYTYDGKMPFSTQLAKVDTATWRLGAVINRYIQNNLKKTAWFMNLGVAIEKTNNTSLLGTTEVAQEITAKNIAGDTVRKVAKKYNAYTDPVDNYRQWSIYGNVYFLFGDRTNGLHIFPSYYMPTGKKGYLNSGLGYLVSFINTKKDQPVINFEGYIQFNDVFNSVKSTSLKFFDRNEIGIRFSIPFASLL